MDTHTRTHKHTDTCTDTHTKINMGAHTYGGKVGHGVCVFPEVVCLTSLAPTTVLYCRKHTQKYTRSTTNINQQSGMSRYSKYNRHDSGNVNKS